MSVKFEETIKTTIKDTVGDGKDLKHKLGEALTKGGEPGGYLAVRRLLLLHAHLPRNARSVSHQTALC
jgi:hypothetical protein